MKEFIIAAIGMTIGMLVMVVHNLEDSVPPDPGHYCVGEYKVYFLGRVSDGQAYVIMPQGRTAYLPLEELRDCQLL